MTPYFFTSKMGRTVALTKNKILVATLVAKTPTAPANVHFFF